MLKPNVLRYVGEALGAVVIIAGLLRFLFAGCLSCLLIALAIIIGGPLEDALIRWARRKGANERERQELAHLVDLSTSIGFLICLGLAVWFA